MCGVEAEGGRRLSGAAPVPLPGPPTGTLGTVRVTWPPSNAPPWRRGYSLAGPEDNVVKSPLATSPSYRARQEQSTSRALCPSLNGWTARSRSLAARSSRAEDRWW